ncbi:MAG: TolC family protein, partial [Planctomycetaceae bacterium]
KLVNHASHVSSRPGAGQVSGQLTPVTVRPLRRADATDSPSVEQASATSNTDTTEAAALPPAPSGLGLQIHTAPVYTVDLPYVLQLVEGQNPQVLYARERIQEALAKVDRADALWLPTIRAGVNWNKHEGRIQDVAGKVIDTSRGSYFTGLGADAVGAGSPRVPGLLAQFHLADAIFEPRIAERGADARQFGSQATLNDTLLETALAYLELLKAHQELAIAHETQQNTQQLVELTGNYARTGQGVAADDDRARAELAVRDNDVVRAEEGIAVSSAQLAQRLSLDPSIRLEPVEPTIVPIEMQSLEQPLPELVASGLMHRPEVSENRSLAAEAAEKLRREKYASLVPSVVLGLSYGGLGGGFGSSFVNFGDRLDVDAIAFWEIRNLGFGERAARCEADSRLQQARFREMAVLDRISREVVEAYTQVESRRRQLAIAESGINAAQSSHERNLQRIRNLQGLPLETLQSIQALAQARREYLRVVTSYNEAQFRLQRALGWPTESQRQESPSTAMIGFDHNTAYP